MNWLRAWVWVLTAACTNALAQPSFDLLSQPGVHAIMRHTTAPGFGDPANFKLGDCSTQRNLSADGIQEAKVLGKTLQDRGLRFSAVYSSQWCRCLDTARAMNLGEVLELPALNSFFQDRTKGDPQTAALLTFLRALNPSDKVLLVSHQVNVTALTGIFPSPGEVILFRLGPQGAVEVLGRM
ncbi:MAG TPA: histidine phosphatase family protein [Limnobacter sp.]|nr:histidine phosphatase family protein [Limnobacter sp.]